MTLTIGSAAREGGAGRASPPSERGTAAVLVLVGCAGVAAGLGLLALSAPVFPHLLAAYLATLTAVAGMLVAARRRARDVATAWLALLLAAAAGPFGVLGVGLLAMLRRRHAPQSELLEAWYERISLATHTDHVTRLCDDVGVGRTVNLDGARPASFPVVVERGTLAERQGVLGLVARRYHPDYLPVLTAALASPQPVVRVQAAAVAAHVRPTIAKEFRQWLDEVPAASESPARALSLVHRIALAAGSRLLDAGDQRRAEALVSRLSDVVAAGARGGPSPELLAAAAGSRGAKATLEQILLEKGRFADLRQLRSAHTALQGREHGRVRRIATPRVAAGGPLT